VLAAPDSFGHGGPERLAQASRAPLAKANREHLAHANGEHLAKANSVTIIGGGIVGLETADLLAARGCRVTIVEMGPSVAAAMARNNRFEVVAGS
jgi:NADPH-dependent 2,4-dienoyl-CoA reductase/sulfur reductase-like enzyme